MKFEWIRAIAFAISIFTIGVITTAATTVAANDDHWKPTPKTHEEMWYGRNGEIEVHWVWTFTPQVAVRDGETTVSLREEWDQPIRNIRGVAREMEFADYASLVGMSIYFADGTTETLVGRRKNYSRKGKIVGIRTRHRKLDRTWEMNWTWLAGLEDEELNDDRASKTAGYLKSAGRAQQMWYYDTNREFLEWESWDNPNLELYLKIMDRRRASEEALAETREALEKLQEMEGELDTEIAQETAAKLLHSIAKINEDGPEQPELLYETAKQMQKLNKVGMEIEKYYKLRYGSEEPESLKFIDKALKWVRAGDTVQKMRETGELNVERFVDDTLALTPANQAGALQGPGGVLFRDSLKWNDKLSSCNTAGLDLVSGMIESGSMDDDRLNELTDRIHRLSSETPWGGDTGGSFVKKLVGQIPVIGGILTSLW